MSRQLDAAQEQKTERRNTKVIEAVEFALVGSLTTQGSELLGFSARIAEWEVLLTIRAYHEEQYQVCFIASDSLANALVKAVRDIQRGKAQWKADKYR